jgi:GTP-binding protein HflX
VTHELARELTELSRELNRQIGLLVSRQGEVAGVIVGTHQQIVIPALDSFRAA